ncbi:MAG: flagellar export chaperone FliS [Bdellovibrionales bacterium RIFCSPHIGHO2_01_FULL_40_29]|nr:MAG: flagellar export chaperone FliS [Bdellovibrionales bacterium RIFCSPHIGHO2_01_FULL_40_29]OFZ34075.1 MAG: flagellar export chaperone FliS [Bdellovibrionales bacterium RIFCSPHIGHO2_02_FULL_40_15]
MANPYAKYKQASVLTASREQILLMLYEAAIKFTKIAIQAMEDKQIAERGKNILKAYDIVMELHATLDHKVGGELSKQLEDLYLFMMDQYTKANIKSDVEPLKSNIKILENLYDGWKQAIEKIKKDNEQKGA